MDETLYQVVFNGSITGEFDIDETKKRFTRLFRLDEARTERLFSGKDYVLKSKVSEDLAMEYAMRVMDAGCECVIEMMPDASDLSQDPNFVERRKTVRRKRFRRPPRPGAIVPDRRIEPSRRKIDLIMLAKQGDFPGNTIPDS